MVVLIDGVTKVLPVPGDDQAVARQTSLMYLHLQPLLRLTFPVSHRLGRRCHNDGLEMMLMVAVTGIPVNYAALWVIHVGDFHLSRLFQIK